VRSQFRDLLLERVWHACFKILVPIGTHWASILPLLAAFSGSDLGGVCGMAKRSEKYQK